MSAYQKSRRNFLILLTMFTNFYNDTKLTRLSFFFSIYIAIISWKIPLFSFTALVSSERGKKKNLCSNRLQCILLREKDLELALLKRLQLQNIIIRRWCCVIVFGNCAVENWSAYSRTVITPPCFVSRSHSIFLRPKGEKNYKLCRKRNNMTKTNKLDKVVNCIIICYVGADSSVIDWVI